jgi:hypothetical protein
MDPCPRRHEGRARVDPVGTASEVLSEGARDHAELGPEVTPLQRPARLLGPPDIVDPVERDVVEETLGVRAEGQRAEHHEGQRAEAAASQGNIAPPAICGRRKTSLSGAMGSSSESW